MAKVKKFWYRKFGGVQRRRVVFLKSMPASSVDLTYAVCHRFEWNGVRIMDDDVRLHIDLLAVAEVWMAVGSRRTTNHLSRR